MTETNKDEYLVLARKYRPQNFSELKGQDALVRTLTNAINSGRVAHAFMLTGVRGVGKTTTARIIARALNCIGPDGNGGPTAMPCGECEQCVSISQDRNVDVLEMDAASRTGVDDIREIIDSVQYAPSAARYKIYIIDEVHMLSKQAFNALLKTLEEPPERVKFVFATTEIRKVPITVLSRCQRFDLRRIGLDVLIPYFKDLLNRESLEAEDEAQLTVPHVMVCRCWIRRLPCPMERSWRKRYLTCWGWLTGHCYLTFMMRLWQEKAKMHSPFWTSFIPQGPTLCRLSKICWI